MTVPYARGKKAFGFCDRCGFRYNLKELKYQIINQRNSKLKVCHECMDEDHPQLQLGRYPVNDPQALFEPRPDLTIQSGRQLNSWSLFGIVYAGGNPIQTVFPVMTCGVGQVKARVS
jgi:hypothetical protein